MKGETAQLAAFAIEQRSFPAEVLEHAKLLVLDHLACSIAAATLPWSLKYRAAIRSLGAVGTATVVYHGDGLSLDSAAFLNGTFGHGNEYDDHEIKSTTHPGSAVIPAVLAIAESRHLSGLRALEATIVGVETMVRVAFAASPHLHDRGHHTPPGVGTFGVAAAASRLLDSDTATCLNAMAIAGSHSAGLRQYDITGGDVKRIHCALAALGGLRAAFFATRGITGPPTVLEGEKGFLNVFAGSGDLVRMLDALSERYDMMLVGFKPFCSCGSTHTSIEALALLQAEHGFGPDDIEKIVVGTSKHVIDHVGKITEPQDVLGAQFSLPFSLAIRLLRGSNGFYDYRQEDLHDEAFLRIARRVTLVYDELANEERVKIGNRGAIVTVHTKNGNVFERRVRFAKGLPENPLTPAEMQAKFMDCVVPRLGQERATQIAAMVANLEHLQDVGDLMRLTVHDTAASTNGKGIAPRG